MRMKKLFIIVFVLFYLLLTTFFSSVKAFSTSEYDYYYLYSFKVDDTSLTNIQSAVNAALKDNRVVSGDYYYFVRQHYDYHNNISTYFVKKSDIDSIYFDFNGDFDGSRYGFAFYNGSNGSFLFNCIAGINDENRQFLFTLSTNFDKDIYIQRGSYSKVYLQHTSPYIADNDDTLARLNGSYFLIFPNNNNVENLHFSLCQTVTVGEGDEAYDKETVLADFKLEPSCDYYNSPTGDEVWYEVPYDDFPSDLTVHKGEIYNWRLQYDLDGKTYYVDRNIVSLVDFTFTGSTR